MKKLLIIMVAHLPILLAATKATAQDNLIARNNKPTPALVASAGEISKTPPPIQPVSVSDRVSKKFTKQFGSTTDAVWAKTDNGFEVRFITNGIDHRVFLTKNGNYHGGMRYYTEKDLPGDVRHKVKSMYYDFTITFVQEVEYDSTTAYLVTIADETTWKIIRVVDGETDVWEAHVKG